jgi:hypothetical protein
VVIVVIVVIVVVVVVVVNCGYLWLLCVSVGYCGLIVVVLIGVWQEMIQ